MPPCEALGNPLAAGEGFSDQFIDAFPLANGLFQVEAQLALDLCRAGRTGAEGVETFLQPAHPDLIFSAGQIRHMHLDDPFLADPVEPADPLF